MKHLLLLSIISLFAGHMHAEELSIGEEVGIGEEVVAPLLFPKFSLTTEYALNRKFHGFADDALRSDLKRRFDYSLSFEAGLLKYFNAGGLFGLGISSFTEPIHVRMGLFAKPYLPIGERFSLFARISAGFAIDLAFFPAAVAYYGKFDKGNNFKRVYKDQNYLGLPYGGFGGATVGVEIFPFSRIGIALEWGIRATLLHGSRSMPLIQEPADRPGTPASFNYMLYELPVLLTLHVII